MRPATKVRARSVGPHVIIREDLIAVVVARPPAVVVVHAPAGHEETTPVTQWLASLPLQRRVPSR